MVQGNYSSHQIRFINMGVSLYAEHLLYFYSFILELTCHEDRFINDPPTTSENNITHYDLFFQVIYSS